jgi:hypothetical protein
LDTSRDWSFDRSVYSVPCVLTGELVRTGFGFQEGQQDAFVLTPQCLPMLRTVRSAVTFADYPPLADQAGSSA